MKAHAIPEAFFRQLRQNDISPILVPGAKGKFPGRMPIGVYDQEILCETCEPDVFAQIDHYGIEALLSRFDTFFRPIEQNGETIAYQSDLVDKHRLLLFLVSILWRASVSRHPFYAKVNLGKYEEIVEAQLLDPSAPVAATFNAVLSRWSDNEEAGVPTTAMLNPHREHWDGVNAYRIYLGKVVAYIKVDRRPFPEALESLSLSSSGPCRIVCRELSRSKDLKVMRKTALAAQANIATARKLKRG